MFDSGTVDRVVRWVVTTDEGATEATSKLPSDPTCLESIRGTASELFIDAKGGTQVPHGGVGALLPDWSERLC